ncbi:nicotinate-nucleotide adenylyltransferase [Lachnospiraceae bacterium LCP25S3_G4]
MVELGVVHGRFQILHLKHIEYILAAKMRCKKLIIGITHSDMNYIRESVNDLKSSTKEANPCTYYERYEMLHDALLDFGVKREEFEIVPFPICCPESLLNYVPKEATFYMSISDAWGEEKLKILTALELEIDILWRKSCEDRGTTGTQVREAIASDDNWRQLVPRTVYEYVLEHGIDERIKALSD